MRKDDKQEIRVPGSLASGKAAHTDSAMNEFLVGDLDSRGNEELLKSFFAEAAIGLSITDLQGQFVKVNPAYCSITGYTEAELEARDFQSITHPDDLPRRVAKVAALLSGEISSFLIEERYIRKDAIVVWVLNSVSVIRDQNGRATNLVRLSQDITERMGLEEWLRQAEAHKGTAQDISERKEAEKALRESEERYRELFENAKEALYVHDLGGRYTSFNRAAEQLSGYSRNEIIGKHFSNFVAPRSLKDVRKNLCKKLDEEGETTYEIDLITKDRRRVPVEVSSRLIYENGEAIGVQGVARDITDRKRAQEALQTYSRRLIEAQEAERQVIARELHDEIGQVLTAVRINLQSLQRSAQTGSQPSPIDESLVIVDEALDRVRELSLNLRPSVLDNLGLSSALRWYVDRYARRSGIVADLRSDVEDGCRLRVELETACFRIVQEALTNVARHAQATHVLVRLTRSNGNLDLRIRDNGVGFDVSELLKGPTLTSALGLRGMEERAVAVQGHLVIDSAPMRGTEVRAVFPLKEERK